MAPMMPLVSTQQSFGMEQPRHVFEHDKGDIDDHDEEIQYSNIDIYGQKHPIETDQMIQNKLRQFDAFLQNRIPDDKKKSVLDAQRKCPELLTDSLKLMFLRCECFNVELAVNRYVKYWGKRVEAFGPVYAFQPLTLNGPLKDDMIPLGIGATMIIQRKNDRNILYLDPSKMDKTKYKRESALRSFWYFFHAILEDEEVQKRGIILLNYNANFSFKNRDPPFTSMCCDMMKGTLPIRMSAIHGTHVPFLYKCILALVMIFLGERLRKRIILHNGTKDEVIAALASYGIHEKDIPTDMGGLFELNVRQWLLERRNAGL